MSEHKNTRPRTRSAKDVFDDLPSPPKPLLGSWFYEGHQVMLYAPSGVGKSYVALSMALAIAGGGTFMDWEAKGPRTVLYVDGEMDVHDLHDRTIQLTNAIEGLNVETALGNLQMLAYRDQDPDSAFLDLNKPEDQNWLYQEVCRLSPDLVVFDNFSTLVTVADENSASAMDPVINLMRRIQRGGGSAVLLVHHARKSNGGAGSYRGSQKLSVTCNSIIRLEPNPDAAPDGGASFKMVWEKVRAKPSEEIKDRTVRLEDDRWIFEVSNSPEFTRFVTAIRSREFCSQDEVAQALNVTKSTISKWKKKAIAEGLITLEEINTCFEEAKQMNDEGDDNEEADF